MEGEAPCSDRCLDVSRRIEGGGFVVGFRLRPGQFGIGDGGCLGACLVVGAQDGDIDMLDGSWLHGFQVCGPASVANFRDDAGLGRVCFGASAAAVEGRGRRADHEALIAKRLVPPACPVRFWRGAATLSIRTCRSRFCRQRFNRLARHARAGVGPTRHLSFKSSPPPT